MSDYGLTVLFWVGFIQVKGARSGIGDGRRQRSLCIWRGSWRDCFQHGSWRFGFALVRMGKWAAKRLHCMNYLRDGSYLFSVVGYTRDSHSIVGRLDWPGFGQPDFDLKNVVMDRRGHNIALWRASHSCPKNPLLLLVISLV